MSGAQSPRLAPVRPMLSPPPPAAPPLTDADADGGSSEGAPPKRVRVAANVATAITVKAPVWVVNLKSNRKALAHGFFEDAFAVLNRHRIVVDLIATSEVCLCHMHGGRVHAACSTPLPHTR
jgi:hypothetical protein